VHTCVHVFVCVCLGTICASIIETLFTNVSCSVPYLVGDKHTLKHVLMRARVYMCVCVHMIVCCTCVGACVCAHDCVLYVCGCMCVCECVCVCA